MANPFSGSNTLSSAGTSSGIGLDPTARMTMVILDLSTLVTSTSTASDITIQGTVDVPTSTWSGTSSASLTWINISTTHYSSASFPNVGVITISSPIAGLRLSSTTFNTSNVTLTALQEIIA